MRMCTWDIGVRCPAELGWVPSKAARAMSRRLTMKPARARP
jgi:hypothetical protein